MFVACSEDFQLLHRCRRQPLKIKQNHVLKTILLNEMPVYKSKMFNFMATLGTPDRGTSSKVSKIIGSLKENFPYAGFHSSEIRTELSRNIRINFYF